MFKCPNCGHTTSMTTETCPYCGTSKEEPNPFEATDAVIDAGPVIKSEKTGQSGYDVDFGTGESLGEAFNIWSNSLGRLVLINLIPAIPIVVIIIIATVMVVSALANLFSGGFQNINPDDITTALMGLGSGTVMVFVTFAIAIAIFTIPAMMGQYRIMDERERGVTEPTGIAATYLSGFRFILPLIGFGLLLYLAAAASVVPVMLMTSEPSAIAIYGFLLLIVGSIVAIRLSIVLPLIALEGHSIFSAIAASNDMIKGRTRTVMGTIGLYLLIMIGVHVALGIVGMIPVLGQLATIAAQLVITPFHAALTFAIYAGLRTKSSTA